MRRLDQRIILIRRTRRKLKRPLLALACTYFFLILAHCHGVIGIYLPWGHFQNSGWLLSSSHGQHTLSLSPRVISRARVSSTRYVCRGLNRAPGRAFSRGEAKR